MECSNFSSSDLPIEMIAQILDSVDVESAKNCESVSKLWNELIALKGEEYQKGKVDFFAKKLVPSLHRIPDGMIDAIGGLKKVCSLPILEIGDRIGSTGHLDFIQVKDMNAPIMRGVDKHNRPFISIKVISGEGNNASPGVLTFFARYTNGNAFVCSPGCEDDCRLLGDPGGVSNEQFANIKKLVEEKVFSETFESYCGLSTCQFRLAE